jgi:hypothetical protein
LPPERAIAADVRIVTDWNQPARYRRRTTDRQIDEPQRYGMRLR